MIEVKALDSFLHGKHDVVRDQKFKLAKADAEDLEKAGLVEIMEEDKPEAETKMQPAVENKMAEAPANKRTKKD